MSYSPDEILKAIETLYRNLDENFDDIYAGCKTDDQRKTLRSTFVASRDAYFKAVKENLCENNPLVDKITSDLNNTNQNIAADLQGIQDIVEFIKLCSAAVQLADSLAKLAAAA